MTTHTLEVWGDLACFTRPELKVERFSYPVITPSAARGIFDAIYWDGKREQQGRASVMRPYFYWQITRIEVLEMPRYIALRRNEVKDKAPADRTIKAWLSYEQKLEAMDILPVTSRMTTTQLDRCMADIQAHFSGRGVVLEYPKDRAA